MICVAGYHAYLLGTYVLWRVIRPLGLSLVTFDVQYDDMKVIRTRVSECLVKRHAFILMHITYV